MTACRRTDRRYRDATDRTRCCSTSARTTSGPAGHIDGAVHVPMNQRPGSSSTTTRAADLRRRRSSSSARCGGRSAQVAPGSPARLRRGQPRRRHAGLGATPAVRWSPTTADRTSCDRDLASSTASPMAPPAASAPSRAEPRRARCAEPAGRRAPRRVLRRRRAHPRRLRRGHRDRRRRPRVRRPADPGRPPGLRARPHRQPHLRRPRRGQRARPDAAAARWTSRPGTTTCPARPTSC